MKPKKELSKAIPLENNFPTSWVWGIIVVTFLLYIPVLSHAFTNWDDPSYVVENLALRDSLYDVLSQQVLGNWHPLTMLSLWLNFKLSDLNPTSYYFVNIVLHLANTYLVFKFIWQLSGEKRNVAFIVALFFAIHPMHVESVAWIAERKDVLYSFFFLLGLNQYLTYVKNQETKSLYVTLLYFGLSLLSKPAAIVFPAVLLLLDYYYDRKNWTQNLKEKLFFVVLAIAFAAITYQIQAKEAIRSLEEHSIIDRFWFANYDIMMYVLKAVVPFSLSAVHPFPEKPLSWIFMISPIAILALLTKLYFFRKEKTVVFGILFFLINLILVIQIITIGQTVMSERYTYIPFIGLFFSLAYYIDKQLLTKNNTQLGWAIIAVLGFYFSFTTYQYIKTWKDPITMWTNVLSIYPKSEAAFYNRGTYYDNTKNFQLAFNDYNELLKINPKHVEGITKHGRYLARTGQFDKAHADFDLAQSLTTDKEKLSIIIQNRAYTYFYAGNKPKAREVIQEAIQQYDAKVDERFLQELNK